MTVSGYADAYPLLVDAADLDALATRAGPFCAAAPPPLRRRCAAVALRSCACPCLAGAPQRSRTLAAELKRRAIRAARSAAPMHHQEGSWVA